MGALFEIAPAQVTTLALRECARLHDTFGLPMAPSLLSGQKERQRWAQAREHHARLFFHRLAAQDGFLPEGAKTAREIAHAVFSGKRGRPRGHSKNQVNAWLMEFHAAARAEGSEDPIAAAAKLVRAELRKRKQQPKTTRVYKDQLKALLKTEASERAAAAAAAEARREQHLPESLLGKVLSEQKS